MIGTQLGSYEVTAKLGEGGMGEVYRATDLRLRREVAIKVLPAAFVADPARLARFEREAHLLAQLHHPNVASVFGLESTGSGLALVMELVEGEDLAQRLARGALPLDDALAVARQVAEGLEAAHDHGIVHRDLKPANLRLRADGVVKILDFGLAKGVEQGGRGDAVQSPTLMNSPTLTAVPGTELGVILGTAAYMAPEQARGGLVDKRADVWAFGVLLHEMLTGRRLFAGETVSDTLAAVLRDTIDSAGLPPATPPELRRLLRRCLERNPKLRLRDIGEARVALDVAAAELVAPPAGSSSGHAPAPLPRSRRWLMAAPWALVALLAVGWLWWARREASTAGIAEPRRPKVLAIQLPEGRGIPLDDRGIYGQTGVLALSPDGRRIAFVAGQAGNLPVQVRDLDSAELRELEGTAGASSPFFSPDGRWVAFFSPGKLKKVSVDGGRPIDLADANLDRGGVWCPDGSIVFAPNATSGLFRLPAGGGEPAPLTTVDVATGERTHRWPAVLPGGREVAFTVGRVGQPGDYEDSRIDAVDLATGTRRNLFRGASMVRFTPVGIALLGRGGQVLALPFDGTGDQSTDEARPVLRGVAGVPASGVVHFAVAADGTLVYAERNPSNDELQLAWLSRSGEEEALDLPLAPYRMLRFSPDGRRVALAIGPGGGRGGDVAVLDLASGALNRLTHDDQSWAPIWTPDGDNITYKVQLPSGGEEIRQRPADGSAEATSLASFPSATAREPIAWMADGSLLFWEDAGPPGGPDLVSLPAGGGAPRPFAATAALEMGAAVSPDRRYVAYVVDASGRADLYVQPYPPTGAQWVVAEGVGVPLWSADGRELFYNQGRAMMSVPVSTAGTFTAGAARKLFDFPDSAVFAVDTSTTVAASPDGRFLTPRSTSGETTTGHLVVVLDWFSVLRDAVAPAVPDTP
jgi:Tol biopolymer transport system component